MTSRDSEIIQLRKNGATYSEIASTIPCSNQTVYHTLFRNGMVNKGKKRSKLSDKQKSEIVSLRKSDPITWSYMELSMKFSCQPPTINKILRQAGLTRKRG